MNSLRALDQRIIDLVQEAYLWLWDRTGAYVATFLFASYVADHFCWGPLGWLDFFFLAFFGWWAGIRYVAQSKDLRRLNDVQRAWRDFSPRLYFTLVMLPFVVGHAAQLEAWKLASDGFMFLWIYLACVQVREREPKEFFPSLKPVGAGA
jgi:hypothetical protein